MKEEEKKDLASYFQHMPKQNKFNSVANYAQTNPSFKQVQQMNSGLYNLLLNISKPLVTLHLLPDHNQFSWLLFKCKDYFTSTPYSF